MEFLVDGKTIDIDTSKKPFSEGSEGKLYLKDNMLYKIYHNNSLCEESGEKFRYHSFLANLKTKQIDLPDDLIFTEDGKYAGYTTKLITKSDNKFEGITLLSKKNFLNNLKTLLEDIKYLSDNYVLLSDITGMNFIFDNSTMYIIDPGRYIVSDKNYERVNFKQFKELINNLICFDLGFYQKFDKRKSHLLMHILNDDIPESCIYDYFLIELEDYNNIKEYAKERIRYIK